MSVVGFDIGNTNCYVGVARQGGIEVITNDYSLHATPACVSFTAGGRSMGVAARQQVNTNFRNTVINFKHIIGRKFDDPIAQKFRSFVPAEMVELADGNIGFKVSYLSSERVFTAEQCLAALFTKLRAVTESQLDGVKCQDCVVSVPTYFTDAQRRALRAAVDAAGLNALRLFNETTAIALAYGIYKQDLPAETERPRHVVFIDVGHAHTQVALAAFHKGKLQMLSTQYSLDVGGLWFDAVLRDHFGDDFKKRFGVDARTNPRAWQRLLDECEKLKKQMSANSTSIPINIECFLDDKDVSGAMKRDDFEALAAPLFAKIQTLVEGVLQDAKMKPEDVDEVELLGGSSRIPMIRRIAQTVYGREPKTTMNQDEAVARGCAMQCAILSPSFRVREFAVKDAQPHRVRLAWYASAQPGDGTESGESDVFCEREEFPFTKMMTLFRTEDFKLDAAYALPNAVPHTTQKIGQWRIAGVRPEADGQKRKVKVKVRIDADGLFAVRSAQMYEQRTVEETVVVEEPADEKKADKKKPEENGEGPEQQPNKEATTEKAKTDGAAAATEPMDTSEKKVEKRLVQKNVAIDLAIEEAPAISFPVKEWRDAEAAMRSADEREARRADAKNALEEYVYEMRDKLSDSLAAYVSERDAEEFRAQLSTAEDWLYDEGENAQEQVYVDRLGQLKKLGEPVVERQREHQARQTTFDELDRAILRAQRAYDDYVAGGQLYAHLESKDMDRLVTAVDERRRWSDEQRRKTAARPLTEAPPVFVHEIKAQLQAFEAIVQPILSKPKPKEATTDAKKPKETAANGGGQQEKMETN